MQTLVPVVSALAQRDLRVQLVPLVTSLLLLTGFFPWARGEVAQGGTWIWKEKRYG